MRVLLLLTGAVLTACAGEKPNVTMPDRYFDPIDTSRTDEQQQAMAKVRAARAKANFERPFERTARLQEQCSAQGMVVDESVDGCECKPGRVPLATEGQTQPCGVAEIMDGCGDGVICCLPGEGVFLGGGFATCSPTNETYNARLRAQWLSNTQTWPASLAAKVEVHCAGAARSFANGQNQAECQRRCADGGEQWAVEHCTDDDTEKPSSSFCETHRELCILAGLALVGGVWVYEHTPAPTENRSDYDAPTPPLESIAPPSTAVRYACELKCCYGYALYGCGATVVSGGTVTIEVEDGFTAEARASAKARDLASCARSIGSGSNNELWGTGADCTRL